MRKRFRTKKYRKVFYIFIFVTITSFIINKNILSKLYNEYFIFKNDKYVFNKQKFLKTISFNEYDKTKKVFKEVEYTNKAIYLYNTHQTEEYVDYNVVDALKYLKDKLEVNNIDVGYDEIDIIKKINDEHLEYKDTYKVTRELIINNYDDECLYIDIHRDSVNKNATTLNYNNKNYARIMFVIGGGHSNYEENYELADSLNNLLESRIPGISRGLFVRKNSNYNQDIGANIILIELGGSYNTKEEVINTLDILSDVLIYYKGE